MEKKDEKITELAQKQRHLFLLEKVKKLQPLTKAELSELARYERLFKKSPSQKIIKPTGRRRKKKRGSRRMPISAAQVKRLGFSCVSLADADTQIDLEKPLVKIIEQYKSLQTAWRRGQLLRLLKGLAPIATVSQAAFKLAEQGFDQFETGQDLRRFLDRDREANELWKSTGINAWMENREALRTTASEGNPKAIQMMEIWFKDRSEETPAADTGHLRVFELAALFGVTRITINDWYKKHGLPRNADGTFEMKTVIRWFEEFTIKKARAGRGPVSVLNPFQQVKTEREKVRLLRDQGAVVERTRAIGWQVAQLQNILNEFHKVPDYANLMFGQTREEIVKTLHSLRDRITASLQAIPAELKLSPSAKQKLIELYEALKQKNG